MRLYHSSALNENRLQKLETTQGTSNMNPAMKEKQT